MTDGGPSIRPDLASLLAGDATIADLERYLDALSAEDRVVECQALGGKAQVRLWDLASAGDALTLEELMPSTIADGETVIFAGRNSLPTFNLFEKRFMRMGGSLVGYNHQKMSFVTGPGYFTVVPSPTSQRELLFDYTLIPQRGPDGWPPVRSNGAGFSRLVYKDLHDYMRRVSRDVVIGSATRLGKPMNSYFVLARR